MAVSFEEYLRRGAQDPQLRGRETEDLRNALQAISSYQRNVDVGRSLGIESTGKPEGGALRRFMGVLERPALAARAGALKAVGFRDPRLARYRNPLEAAAAGARGELRITGGDIFRTERDDNPLVRAAKLAGAFTFDVATDPITYVGTPAALGRKTAAELAFRSAPDSFNTAIQATARATGRNIDEVAEDLTKRAFETSDVAALLKRKDPELVQQVEERFRRAGLAAVGEGADLTDEAVKKAYEEAGQRAVGAWQRQIAEDQFGNALGMSLYAGGRRGLRGDLAEFLGSREAAEQVFEALPERVRGGLYFVNPITGQRIARVSSGRGDALGPVADWGNKIRTYTAAVTGQGAKLISGTRGKHWQKVREAARESYKASGTRGTERISGFRTLKKYEGNVQLFLREKEITARAANLASRPIKEARHAAGMIAAFRPKDAADAARFDEAVRRAYYGQPLGDDAPDEVVELAQELRAVIARTAAEARLAGIEIADAGEGYIPLVLSQSGRKSMAAQRAAAGKLSASRGGGVEYNPSRSRDFGQVVITNAEDAAEMGFDIGDDVISLNPVEANFEMFRRQLVDLAAGDEKSIARIARYLEGLGGKLPDELQIPKLRGLYGQRGRTMVFDDVNLRMFEEDPVRIMASYVDSTAARIESAELLRLGFDYGILTRGQADFATEISGRGAKFAGALGTVNRRVYDAVKANPKLARLVDPDTGIMSEVELASIGIIAPEKMTRLLDNLQMQQVVPDSELAAKEFEELTMQWFRLSALAESGQRLSTADALELEKLTTTLGQANQLLDRANDIFRTLDATHTRLAAEYKLTPEEARELVRTVSDTLDGTGLSTRGRLPQVSKDLEAFLFDADEDLTKASDGRILEIVDGFFNSRQISSAADQEAAFLGLRFLGTGDDVEGVLNIPQTMRMIRARAGVKQLLEARARVASNPNEISNFIEEVYDPAFQIWKAGATSLRGPGYTFLNMMGNLWQNYVGDIAAVDHRRSADFMLAARRAVAQASDEVVARGGQRLRPLDARAVLGGRADEILREEFSEEIAHGRSLFDMMEDFEGRGGLDSSQSKEALDTARSAGIGSTARDIRAGRYATAGFDESGRARVVRSVADAVLNNRVSGTINSINTDVETWTRFAAYINTFIETGSVDAAMDRVFLLHFNYGDLSNWDLALRRIFPFYVWSRNNIPSQVRTLFMQPGKIRRLMSAQEALKGQLLADEEDAWLQEVLPDYIAEVEGYATRMKSGPFNIAVASKLPFDDVDRIIQLGGSFGLKLNHRELGSMLGPQVTFPIEMLTQRDLSTGGAFDPAGREATGWRRPLGYLPLIGSVGPGGERRIPEALDKTLSELAPPIGTFERILTGGAAATRALGGPEAFARLLEAPAPQYMRERGMSNLLNVTGVSPLFGASATTLAPRTISSALRERRRRQTAAIGEAAGRAGVSVEWVRERLAEGYTPEEIALLIQQGEGEREAYESAQAERSLGPSENLQGLLDRLGQ